MSIEESKDNSSTQNEKKKKKNTHKPTKPKEKSESEEGQSRSKNAKGTTEGQLRREESIKLLEESKNSSKSKGEKSSKGNSDVKGSKQSSILSFTQKRAAPEGGNLGAFEKKSQTKISVKKDSDLKEIEISEEQS